MKFSYKFSNLLGSVYRKGNILFSPDGNSVISPVGNRVSIFDLKNNHSETLPIESNTNITCIALSPDGVTLILVNEEGDALLCSLLSRTVIHTYKFHRPINCIQFSPDGKKFAATRDNMVQVFHAPGKTKEFNPFVLYRTFYGAYDETVCIDWTTDSRAFCVGSKDMTTRVYGTEPYNNLIVNSIGGHNGAVVGAFFEKDSLNVYIASRSGHLSVWKCDTELDGLTPYTKPRMETDAKLVSDNEEEPEKKEQEDVTKNPVKIEEQIKYRKLAKHSYKESLGEGARVSKLTSVAFQKDTHILVSGFKDGSFYLHELPDFNLIHSLSISDQTISSVAFNKTGDWIALACSGLGQLLVWEWQSETYVLKQQGHFNNISCLSYSPDGQFIATGGEDGKVKLWNTSSGFCFVTFNEHLGGVTGVTFTQNGQVVLSSSLDGTVRAFDLNRYRNFRTFTSPRPAQFSCITVDNSGDIVCAGGMDTFEIFVWSMQTGRLIEVLAGHEGPVSSLSFSSNKALLASGSWDKTVKLWDVFESKGAKETIVLSSDVLAVRFRPDGNELAVSTLDSQISFWDPANVVQTHSIEGRHDLGYSRKEGDKITAKKSAAGKAFMTVCYSADGKCLLAAGQSKSVCIYSVPDQLLVKKFDISCNMSFDGMEEYLDRKKMTEWGSLSLVDQGEGDRNGHNISLPGVKKGDMSSRHWKPEVRVVSIQFSPTGRAWAAATTEGLMIYSLDSSMVFDPFDLDIEVTPNSTRKALAKGEYSTALILSFKLNEMKLKQEVLEHIPVSSVEVIVENLPDIYVDKLLVFLATQIENTTHIEFYLLWVNRILMIHGLKLKQRSQRIISCVRTLQKNVNRKYEDIGKICDHNKYSIDYILALSQCKRKHAPPSDGEGEVEGEGGDSDSVMEGVDELDSSDEDFMTNLMEKVT
ncbi:periodic tryptophan protein 2 homolog [Magallana gigas]|uniref:periodic tryptophan protein 2 homolog n=1 Tax=Magallana gigas TaxID=29159 RepID=UPI00334019D8